MSKKKSSSSNSEYVVVQVRIPKPVVEFIEALAAFSGFDVTEFWKQGLLDHVGAVLDSQEHLEPDWLMDRYGLEKFLKDC